MVSTTETPKQVASLPALPRLAVVLRRKDGSLLRRASLPKSHLLDLLYENWRDFGLRRGLPETVPENMSFRVVPMHPDGAAPDDQLRGFQIESTNPRGDTFRRSYNVEVFADPVRQIVQQLVGAKQLGLTDEYSYELLLDTDAEVAADEPIGTNAEVRFQPPVVLRRELAPLLRQAETVGTLVDGHFAVIYTRAAYEAAERFARRGALAQPPRETGCALVGVLGSCPETGELFVVVTLALEATDADEQELSLTYSGKTWRRVQTVVGAMQMNEETRSCRIVGQAHGHNFLPAGGAPPCELCHQMDHPCGRRSDVASVDDRTWTQACFARQPWALCHIFGLNARQENVQALYTLRDNRLVERGFYLIDEFLTTGE